MKMYVPILSLILFVSCKSGTGKTPGSDSANATQNIINTAGAGGDSVAASGSKLIAANDCLTCHQINQKSFGPSYQQIANKYENNQGNIENLADRIIKGGKGLWGQNAMTPHPNLSTPVAEQMVRYILTLRDTTAASK